MNSKVLEVHAINKFFGKFQALHDVSFSVAENEIVGFVGPNGAGKSTTMKCISNLIYPDSGTITICGHDLKTDRDNALSMLACQIESPGLYSSLSGYNNLKLMTILKGQSKERMNEVLDFINIGDRIKRKAGTYSMGMKQRLALGIAILNKPKLLMLDEPTNGLDPAGVFALRETLLKLKAQGTSILLSSHQLGELEKIADRIIWINQGVIVERNIIINQYTYRLRVDNLEKALDLAKKYTVSSSIDDDYLTAVVENELKFDELLNCLIKNNTHIYDVNHEILTLEDIYNDIYGGRHEKTD